MMMKSLSDLKFERDAATSKKTSVEKEIELTESFVRLFEKNDAGFVLSAAVRALDELCKKHVGTAEGTYFDQVRNFFSGEVPFNPTVQHSAMVKSMHNLHLPS